MKEPLQLKGDHGTYRDGATFTANDDGSLEIKVDAGDVGDGDSTIWAEGTITLSKAEVDQLRAWLGDSAADAVTK